MFDFLTGAHIIFLRVIYPFTDNYYSNVRAENGAIKFVFGRYMTGMGHVYTTDPKTSDEASTVRVPPASP